MTARGLAPILVGVILAVAFAASAVAQTGIVADGTLSGLDVFNDDPGGRQAEGFEIEIEGATGADILGAYTHNRYGNPTVLPYADRATGSTGVIVRYAARWNGTAWILPPAFSSLGGGTPYIDPDTITARMGRSCVYGATADYPTSGCEHFGVALAFQSKIGKISYYWLYDAGLPKGLSGHLVRGLPASLPAPPVTTLDPPAAGRPPVVIEPVAARPEPAPAPGNAETEFGDAVWVKVFSGISPLPAELDRLTTPSAAVPHARYTWHLLQEAPKDGDGKPLEGERQDVEAQTLPQGYAQVTTLYEYYRFGNNQTEKPVLAGLYDPETHMALCATFYAGKEDATEALYGVLHPRPVQTGCHNAEGADAPYTQTYWTLRNGSNGPTLAEVKGGNLGSYIGANIVAANIK